VIFRNSPSTVTNFSFKGYSSRWGFITAENYTSQSGDRNWAIPFVKFIDTNNLIGARLNGGKIEIVRRKNGIWDTIGSAPAVEGNWAVKIMNGYIEVYVDGDLKINKNHNVPGHGYFGISGHQWETGEIRLLKNYDVSASDLIKEMAELRDLIRFEHHHGGAVTVTGVITEPAPDDWSVVNDFTSASDLLAGTYGVVLNIKYQNSSRKEGSIFRVSTDGGTTWSVPIYTEVKDINNVEVDDWFIVQEALFI